MMAILLVVSLVRAALRDISLATAAILWASGISFVVGMLVQSNSDPNARSQGYLYLTWTSLAVVISICGLFYVGFSRPRRWLDSTLALGAATLIGIALVLARSFGEL
jgi:cell division protein FtsW (lipid II flippase)